MIARLDIRPRWWLRHYLFGLALVSSITGMEPDWVKVKNMIGKGLSVRLEPVSFGIEA